jgi:hypothetical protein
MTTELIGQNKTLTPEQVAILSEHPLFMDLFDKHMQGVKYESELLNTLTDRITSVLALRSFAQLNIPIQVYEMIINDHAKEWTLGVIQKMANLIMSFTPVELSVNYSGYVLIIKECAIIINDIIELSAKPKHDACVEIWEKLRAKSKVGSLDVFENRIWNAVKTKPNL